MPYPYRPRQIFYAQSTVTRELHRIIDKNDVHGFHQLIEKFRSYENAFEHLSRDHNYNITDKTTYEIIYISVIATMIILYERQNVNLMTILFDDYQFMPNEDFLIDNIYYMSFKMFKLFYNRFDLTKYINEVHHIFVRECENIKHIQQLIDMGYDINNLNRSEYYNGTAISRMIRGQDYKQMEYLLDVGLEFKPYEMDILKHCIEICDMKMLAIFINRGANLSILNADTNMPTKECIDMHQLLTSNDINPLIILNLLMFKSNYALEHFKLYGQRISSS